MRLPDWLNVALEGGALELQRALVRYRNLRRAVGGDWRGRAGLLAEQCAAVAREEFLVDQALERALRRARHDPRAGAATHLALAVERERRKTRFALAAELGRDAPLTELVGDFGDAARGESLLDSAWKRFNLERIAWTLGFLFVAAALPLASWWGASHGGFVPVLLDLAGLVELPLGPPAIAGVLALGWLRVASWQWLGLLPPPLGTAPGVAVCIATGLVGVVASVAGNVPLFALAVGVLTMLALSLLGSMWRVPREALLTE